MNNKFDRDAFLRVAKEIDEKRKAITRISKTITWLLGKIWRKYPEQESLQTILEVTLGEYICVIEYHDRTIYVRFSNHDSECLKWWYNDIPVRAVNKIFSNLSKIVEEADKSFPEAGICKHFENFIEQANRD